MTFKILTLNNISVRGLERLPRDRYEVARLLAHSGGPSVRELEGALNRVLATATLRGLPITVELAQQALGSLAAHRAPTSAQTVQEIVSEHFHVSVAELISHRRDRQLVQARQIAMYLCKALTHASLPEIGRSFGGKHHSTVIHSIRKIEDMRHRDGDFNNLINNFMESFR